ncbi:hypothetical protein XU18_1097 [Perkinsela sp. CCAP 1560/4]|nr:hypothetical protein XU18_1097 [Perkinsela sp. CCAP 1560/4]|eukprot:KNH08384.1 hypothetical protein XU18_1097 [Perkinsela sp. CCAP 1560/4]
MNTDDLRFERILGSGSFSVVHLCTYVPTGKKYAVKCISKKDIALYPDLLYSVAKEFSVLSECAHFNIVKMDAVFEHADAICFALEHCECGDLLQLILAEGKVSKKKVQKILKQLLDTLEYLHFTMTIAHGDIKPENIVFDKNMDIRLVDFGSSFDVEEKRESDRTKDTVIDQLYQKLPKKVIINQTTKSRWRKLLHTLSKKLNSAFRTFAMVCIPCLTACWNAQQADLSADCRQIAEHHGVPMSPPNNCTEAPVGSTSIDELCEDITQRTDYCGTLDYMPPEMLRHSSFSKAGDFWAVGCILYYMVTGVHPFAGDTDKEVVRNILVHHSCSEEDLSFDKASLAAAMHLANILLNPDPALRMSWVTGDSYGELKKHPFFSSTA